MKNKIVYFFYIIGLILATAVFKYSMELGMSIVTVITIIVLSALAYYQGFADNVQYVFKEVQDELPKDNSICIVVLENRQTHKLSVGNALFTKGFYSITNKIFIEEEFKVIGWEYTNYTFEV